MNGHILPLLTLAQLEASGCNVLDAPTRTAARDIIAQVEQDGETALLALAREFGDWNGTDPWWFDAKACHASLAGIDAVIHNDLEGAATRIRTFAVAQRAALNDVDCAIPGGRAGHTMMPMERAGCYAPGGRFPLPSSVLMTVIPARVAGVAEVWVATPRPGPVMLAAAAIAGADGVLGIGGAQAIAALACGVGPVPRCDIVVGPGNRFVTAAKEALAGRVAIDSLAGPSELVVVADETADPQLVAADLIAQAEHDVDAMVILVTLSPQMIEAVRAAIEEQLIGLPTAAIASRSLRSGGAILVTDLREAQAVVNRLAAEHLEVLVDDPGAFVSGIHHAGAVFLGKASAEVFGDYGAGPNHVLPTSGRSRMAGGLSVFTFLRARTWLQIDDPCALAAATARLARLEGLEGHARAAELRGRNPGFVNRYGGSV